MAASGGVQAGSSAVKKSRVKRKLSQIDLAQRMKSSQSRIAKIEAGDRSVSLDLIAGLVVLDCH